MTVRWNAPDATSRAACSRAAGPRTAPRFGAAASARRAVTASPPSSAATPAPLHVLKRTGERQRFDRTKLRAALLRSTHKRQVGAVEVEALVDRVELAIDTAGGELGAERIGELCVEGLRELDYGAYLQFLGTLPSPDGAGRETPTLRSRRPAGPSEGRAACIVPRTTRLDVRERGERDGGKRCKDRKSGD